VCVSDTTQKTTPRKVAVGGVFFWDHAGLTFCMLLALWEIHKYFDFCHTIVTKRA